MHFRPLKTEFDGRADQKGYHFRQIKRDGLFCIYQKVNQNGVKYYEVFKIKLCPEYVIGGVKIESHEAMPPSSNWGVESFSFKTLEEAEKKFKEIK